MEDFDINFRNLFNEAEVAAPDGVYDKIAHRLEVRRRWRIAGYFATTAAIAAAIACLVVFIPFGRNNISDNYYSQALKLPSNIDTPSLERPATLYAGKVSGSEGVQIISAEELLESKPTMVAQADVAPTSENEAVVTQSETTVPNEASGTEQTETVAAMPSFEIKETENFYEGSALKEQHKVGGLQLTALGNIESNNVISKLTRSKLHTSAIDFQQADKNYVTPDSEARYSIPLTFGIGVRIPFAKRWSIASGLDCSILTTRYDKANHYINGSITEYTNVTNRIIYLGIPLNVYFDIISNHRVSFYVYAGGTIEKGISNRYTAPAGLNHTEKIAGVQMSVQAGLGVEFKIVGPMNFFIDPAVKYFFTNETQPVSIRSRQPFSMGFDAGLRFTL